MIVNETVCISKIKLKTMEGKLTLVTKTEDHEWEKEKRVIKKLREGTRSMKIEEGSNMTV